MNTIDTRFFNSFFQLKLFSLLFLFARCEIISNTRKLRYPLNKKTGNDRAYFELRIGSNTLELYRNEYNIFEY